MNIAAIVAGVLSLLAFLVHTLIGDKELRSFKPKSTDHENLKNNWVQARAGWHWVSIDLLILALALLYLGIGQSTIGTYSIYLSISTYFFLTGSAWLLVVVSSSYHRKQIYILAQWLFLLCSKRVVFYCSGHDYLKKCRT